MWPVITWYLVLSLLGWLAFPLAYRLLPALADRGFAFSRALGLFVWGLAFWLLGSYASLPNNYAGLLAALLVLGLLVYWAARSQGAGELRAWLRANRGYILKVEVLFLLAFVAMAVFRATHPSATGTEKPMELAFINSVMASPGMPPADPWLSGYSISYYYFGYVMVAMLAAMTGVGGAIAFNLGIALVFALAALGAYGLVYNLLALRFPGKAARSAWLAFLAPVIVLLVGNLEAVFELLHAQHLFGPWTTNADGVLVSEFWSWLDLKDLVFAPAGDPSLTPRNYGTGYWWWWRASRVINDVNLLGMQQELIDEFPAFSFVLGDLHPHVLSMPFVMLAMGLALNIFRSNQPSEAHFLGLRISSLNFVMSVIMLGGLGFLNIWDLPIYLVFFTIAYMVKLALESGWHWNLIGEAFKFLLALAIGAVLLYLPFFVAFSSQAGGILPNLLNPTRGAHLWLMFGTLFPLVLTYLLYQWRGAWNERRLLKGLVLGLGFAVALWALSLGFAWLLVQILPGSTLAGALAALGAPDSGTLLAESLRRRLLAVAGVMTLALLLGLAIGRLWPPSADKAKRPRDDLFVIILALVGTLLVIAPEFIYLRDYFGTRMNTVFKFYFQAWQMLALVAAYGAAVLLVELRGLKATVFSVLFVIIMALGLLFPAYAFSDRVVNAGGQPLSLDASRHLSPGQQEAIAWLNQATSGVLVEAIGGQYSDYARYATHSAQIGVLGWPGHEGQWRGNSVNYGPRQGDVETLYSTADWATAREILQRYEIDYVIVGALEHSAYAVNQEKFTAHLPLVFQNTEVSIYQVP